ncbi:MAG TPA: hypothetical protein VH817_04580 [Thermoleophilaceae bacterium]
MKAAFGAILIAAVLAGCGGGGGANSQTNAAAPPSSNPQSPTSPSSTTPTATTNTPPTATRTTPEPVPDAAPSTQPLKVGSSYTCGGKPLKGIESADAVKVKPKFVKPGQSFTVFITNPNAKVAVVSLAGVSTKPIQSNAKKVAGELAATLKMPASASCGNKLIEIEGDISAEAYVGVTD